jgi:hypothetical protein
LLHENTGARESITKGLRTRDWAWDPGMRDSEEDWHLSPGKNWKWIPGKRRHSCFYHRV